MIKKYEMKKFYYVLLCDKDCGEMEFIGRDLGEYCIHKCQKCGVLKKVDYKYPFERYETVKGSETTILRE